MFSMLRIALMGLFCGALTSGAQPASLQNDSSVATALPREGAAPVMYLCADSGSAAKDSGTSVQKLVYGYIDAMKTACMSEQEFLALYWGAVEDTRQDSIAALHTVAPDSTGERIIEAIGKGERNFYKATLREFDFMGLNIEGANFKHADLEKVDFRDANLRGADFRGANLKGAYFKNAKLAGARFDGADITDATFQAAVLTGAKGLSVENAKTARTFKKALLDKKLFVQLREECPEKLGIPKPCWKKGAWQEGKGCAEAKKMYENSAK
jgi:hypothetical protein